MTMYAILTADGSGIDGPRPEPFNAIIDLMFMMSLSDGAQYVSFAEPGAPPTVLQVRRNGVWHAWEPPLSEAQEAAYQAAMRGESILITGPGGCGKSEVVRRIVRDLRYAHHRQVAVTGSTGLAAVSIGGTTIHSFLGTGIGGTRPEVQKGMTTDRLSKAGERIIHTDTIVVDEVSMLHGDYLDMAHWWMNLACQNGVDGPPFAGKQMIFVGDFLQLPPVIMSSDNIVKRYGFEADAWARLDPAYHSLLKNFRQVDDEDFRKHLLRIRRGQSPDDTLAYFNARVGAKLAQGGEPTQTFPTNKEADQVNDQRLRAIKSPLVSNEAYYEGHPNWQEALKRNLPCEDPLDLKIGAEVLCTYNVPDEGFINGTRGTVKEFTKDRIIVQKRDGTTISVGRHKWEMKNAQDNVLAAVKQYPLRLAWALTIHKCQGATLDEMVFDPTKVFERAQAYVALSRVRSIEGLRLLKPLTSKHVRASAKVVDWYRQQRDKMAAKPPLTGPVGPA